MKLPRNISGSRLATLLGKYDYQVSRQVGSHMRLTSSIKGYEHRITIPRHRHVKVGTLAGILEEVASYLDVDREALSEELFG